MAKQLVLIIGGARSGKSAFAQSLAGKLGERVTFIATAEAGDDEMRARIENHRRSRPSHWQTVETPTGVGAAMRDVTDAQVIVLDCLALFVSNILLAEEDATAAEAQMEGEVADVLSAYRAGEASLIVVTNEVGMGVVPAYELGRTFRDLIGRANATFAHEADRVYWMVAGLAVEVKASGLGRPWEEI